LFTQTRGRFPRQQWIEISLLEQAEVVTPHSLSGWDNTSKDEQEVWRSVGEEQRSAILLFLLWQESIITFLSTKLTLNSRRQV